MTRQKGYTLIELMVVIAIAATLAALAYMSSRAGLRNASLGGTAFNIALKLSGMQARALADSRDYLFVMVDAPANNATNCEWNNTNNCAQLFIFRADTTSAPALLMSPSLATWNLAAFDVGTPVVTADPARRAELLDRIFLPKGIHFDLGNATVAPAPFNSATMFDPAITGNCIGGRRCFAFMYTAEGMVSAKGAAGGTALRLGYGFVLGSEQNALTLGADRKAIVLGFPSGAVKTFGAGI